jgi:hypothetical protein
MDLVFASVANVAALVILFSLARAIYYPFWAASAPDDALERSWGGPSAVGATLAHWLVASVIVAAMYGIILIVDRRFMEPR